MFDTKINQKNLRSFLERLEKEYGDFDFPRVVIYSDGSGHFEEGIEGRDILDFNSISELNAITADSKHALASRGEL